MPQDWRQLVDETGNAIEGYEISREGQVRSYWGRGRQGLIASPKLICHYIDDEDRALIELRIAHRTKKKFLIHRLVAFAFLPSPASQQTDVLHINHDTLDNRASNLAWATKQEIANHSDQSPDRWSGNGGAPKLTRKQINAIARSELPRSTLAQRYRISERQVSRIKSGLTGRRPKRKT
jgi:hypothetical protein